MDFQNLRGIHQLVDLARWNRHAGGFLLELDCRLRGLGAESLDCNLGRHVFGSGHVRGLPAVDAVRAQAEPIQAVFLFGHFRERGPWRGLLETAYEILDLLGENLVNVHGSLVGKRIVTEIDEVVLDFDRSQAGLFGLVLRDLQELLIELAVADNTDLTVLLAVMGGAVRFSEHAFLFETDIQVAGGRDADAVNRPFLFVRSETYAVIGIFGFGNLVVVGEGRDLDARFLDCLKNFDNSHALTSFDSSMIII